MNPFLLPPRERLADWKRLRATLADLEDIAQLKAVSAYWARAPLSMMAYDAEDLADWPTIWEMVSDGDWCRCSVAVGMEATLRLAGWPPERMVLRHIRDLDISEILLVLEIDGTHWLNYDHGIVAELQPTRQIEMARWRFNGKLYGRSAT